MLPSVKNGPDALEAMRKGIAVRGGPQKLLTDNGSAVKATRLGWETELVTYAASVGVEVIARQSQRPTIQGKNERFHQTLFRWLDKQPLAATCAELQAQVAFDRIYNTQHGQPSTSRANHSPAGLGCP